MRKNQGFNYAFKQISEFKMESNQGIKAKKEILSESENEEDFYYLQYRN
jgi:hypothetical protein